jgi:hypothetical protein
MRSGDNLRFSGEDLRWGKFVAKRDRPAAYWGMAGLKVAFILFLPYKILN